MAFYVVDIFIAADKIKRYTVDFDNAEHFLHSELEWDAVIRELEIIGEATKHLLKENFIDQQYQSIVDFRNHIVHGYFALMKTSSGKWSLNFWKHLLVNYRTLQQELRWILL